MSKRVDFYFDYGSPTAYLAYTQLPAIAKRTGATVNYRPMLLGGVFQATGNQSPAQIPAKGNYMFTDLKWFAARYGVKYQRNAHFLVNTLNLMRGALAALRDGYFMPYSDAIFQAIWVDDVNLNEVAQIGKVLSAAGLDAQKIMAATQEPAIKEALKTATEEAVKRGVFGAPTFFVGEHMHFGQDRLPYVEELLGA